LDKQDLAAAHNAYDQARQRMQAIPKKPEALVAEPTALMAPELPRGAGALGPTPAAPVSVPASLTEAYVRQSLPKLTRELKINNWVLFAVALGLSPAHRLAHPLPRQADLGKRGRYHRCRVVGTWNLRSGRRGHWIRSRPADADSMSLAIS
jgi:hypothetical protein